MIQTTNHSQRSSYISFIILALCCIGILQAAIWAVNHKSFNGCVIVGYEANNVLVIELDDELATGTDASCKAAGMLILEICQQGYKVRVTNWALTEAINIEQAFWLARGY